MVKRPSSRGRTATSPSSQRPAGRIAFAVRAVLTARDPAHVEIPRAELSPSTAEELDGRVARSAVIRELMRDGKRPSDDEINEAWAMIAEQLAAERAERIDAIERKRTESARQIPVGVNPESFEAAGWLAELWRPWFGDDVVESVDDAYGEIAQKLGAQSSSLIPQMRTAHELDRGEYARHLAVSRTEDMFRLHSQIANLRTPRKPTEILMALQACPPLGYVRRGHSIIPELTKETVRRVPELSARARRLRDSLKQGSSGGRALLSSPARDAHMDQGILRAMVDSIGRLEARAGENAYALERLRRAARISDRPGTVVRQTTRLRFLSLAGVQIARELAKIVPAPNVRDLRGPHKAATAIAVEILNIVYGPILDRPLTIEDLKSRESYRRSKT